MKNQQWERNTIIIGQNIQCLFFVNDYWCNVIAYARGHQEYTLQILFYEIYQFLSIISINFELSEIQLLKNNVK